MKKESVRLTLLFHRIQQLSRDLNKYLNESLEEEDIYMSHWAVLFQLESNDGCMTQAELKERLNIEAPPLSRVIQKLVKLGYIEKNKSKDQRTNDITITRKGEERYPFWRKAIGEAEERLLEKLGTTGEKALEEHVLSLSRMVSEERRGS
ncbi:MarR family transcriptional regulator [Halobacillus litoralis]|uniref:MarR family transcriptional regulator n=1 Tax=Halobacillus litoralis TaxID=45668 RepID=A0A410MES6_9BACI|nr:MarR family transcriptional regulator [Halobacillus litoralis]